MSDFFKIQLHLCQIFYNSTSFLSALEYKWSAVLLNLLHLFTFDFH